MYEKWKSLWSFLVMATFLWPGIYLLYFQIYRTILFWVMPMMILFLLTLVTVSTYTFSMLAVLPVIISIIQYLNSMGENGLVTLKILFGVSLHFVCFYAEQQLLWMLVEFCLVSCLFTSQTKLLLNHDRIGITEEMTVHFIKITMELLWKRNLYGIIWLFSSLIGVVSLNSPPVARQNFIYKNRYLNFIQYCIER
ncbi:hypothetical protein O6P43_018754 [Quillaja saponaria]|uniref:Uncharacterized protein n=1 Tax=Quillaja saponaria TaxID=32244 RepID=A0AAD7LHE4_QUISA|nr:hypothetical protein O6P43_018754 [Quillaja saponaria]